MMTKEEYKKECDKIEKVYRKTIFHFLYPTAEIKISIFKTPDVVVFKINNEYNEEMCGINYFFDTIWNKKSLLKLCRDFIIEKCYDKPHIFLTAQEKHKVDLYFRNEKLKKIIK